MSCVARFAGKFSERGSCSTCLPSWYSVIYLLSLPHPVTFAFCQRCTVGSSWCCQRRCPCARFDRDYTSHSGYCSQVQTSFQIHLSTSEFVHILERPRRH